VDLNGLDIVKLVGAILAGGIVGLERELHDKPAGFRTNILICLGAALFTLLSLKLGAAEHIADRTRIAAQIVTGVGFLGAGAIIHHRSQVHGLTTAATIWAVASIGMAFGAGEFGLGIVGALLTTGVVFGLSFAEYEISGWRSVAIFELTLEPTPEAEARVRRLIADSGVRLRALTLGKRETELIGRLVATGPRAKLDALATALLEEQSVHTLSRG
jgi:putative Mg2+ transporter-C (MgtC) family protein